MIYLDNAATSGRKPESVYIAMDSAVRNCSGNPGRSGHAVSLAAGTVNDIRSIGEVCRAAGVPFLVDAAQSLGTRPVSVLETGTEAIREKEENLMNKLRDGLGKISGVKLYSPEPGFDTGNVLSFTVDGMDPAEVSMILDSGFGIMVRSGLHCAPYAHRMLGTLETGGTIRVSPNIFTEISEIDTFLDAIEEIAGGL